MSDKEKKNLLQLNTENNPFDAEAQKLGGRFTEKITGKGIVYCPPNAILVKENRFTGKITFARGAGLKFMIPLIYKTHFVLASKVNVDYEKIKYPTKDGIDASVDFALFIRITDPAKYKISSAKPMEDLKITICELIKNYVRSMTYDQLSRAKFDLKAIDRDGSLKKFEELNGIEVTGGKFKQIELPEHLKRIYDDKVEAENSQRVAEVKIRTKMMEEMAKIEREKKKREAEREIIMNEIVAYVQMYKTQVPGATDAEISKLIRDLLQMKTANNSYFVGGDSKLSSDVLRGDAMGRAFSNANNSGRAQRPVVQNSMPQQVNGVQPKVKR